MTITVHTGNLAGLLMDAAQTADAKSAVPLGVHVNTYRGAAGDEPGQTDLLAATSTDRYVTGHGYIPVEGQIMPSVWPLDAVKTVLAICKGLTEARGKDHTLDVEVVQRQDEEDNAWMLVTVRETPALFEADTEFQFRAETEAGYPLKGIWQVLTGQPSKKRHRPSNEVGWSPRVVAAVSAVAKRQKESMWWYRTPSSPVWRVQIGDSWIGAIHPLTPSPGSVREQPYVEPLLVPQEGWDETPLVDAEVVDDEPTLDDGVVPEDQLPEIGGPRLAIEAAPLAIEAGDDVVDAEVVDDEDPDAAPDGDGE